MRDDDKPHTTVQDLDQLHRWLEDSRAPQAPVGWDPDVTDVMNPPQLDRLLASAQAHAAMDDSPTVSGALGSFSVVELLQLFAARGRSGLLAISDGRSVGRVYFKAGELLTAAWDDDDGDDDPMSALRRVARVRQGEFWFGPPSGDPPVTRVDAPTFIVLMDLASETTGFDLEAPSTQIDGDVDDVPEGARLHLPDKLEPRLRDLSPDELDVLQDAHNAATMVDQLETSLDAEGAREVVRSLVKRGYLRVEDD